MDFRIEQHIDASVERVDAALIDPAFLARLDALPKIGRSELVAQERDGDHVEQEVRYVFAGELSSAVRAVVDPKKLSWIIESQHDLHDHSTTWRIIPDHYRDRLTSDGKTWLLDNAGSTRRVVEGHVKVHMALVGSRVERAIVSGLKEHFADEAAELGRFLEHTDD